MTRRKMFDDQACLDYKFACFILAGTAFFRLAHLHDIATVRTLFS